MSTCADDARGVALDSALAAGAGKIVQDAMKPITNARNIKMSATEKVARKEASAIAVETAVSRVTRQGELPEEFIRPGDVTVKAAKGKIYRREAQQADIMNQFGLANGYARITGLGRGYMARKEAIGPADQLGPLGAKMTMESMNLHDAWLRSFGIPLTTVKAGALQGQLHYSHLTFGDITKVFFDSQKLMKFGKYFFRNADATKNIPNQNAAEAVRRIIEHADVVGKISMDTDIEILRPQVLDALLNPSGLGKPAKGTDGLKGFEDTLSWLKGPEGTKLANELTDELLSEDLVSALVKANEEMRLVNMVTSKGDGLKMSAAVLDMITKLPNPNDRMYAYGDFLMNDRFNKIFKEDALVKMTPEELNLAFGQRFIAEFLNGIEEGSLVMAKSYAKKANGKQTDLTKSKKTGTRKEHNTRRAEAEDHAEIVKASATKAADDVQADEVRVQEPSAEAAQIARGYQLEFDVGPVLGGAARAFGWLSDKATMGGKIKTSLIGAQNIRLHNAATMSAQMGKFFESLNKDTKTVNSLFEKLQNGSLESVLLQVPAAQRDAVNSMATFIQDVFGMGQRSNMDMNGIFADEMATSMKSMGLGRYADEFTAMGGYADDAMGEWWKDIKLAEGENALTIMSKVYAAMQLAKIKPAMANSLRHHFSHTAEGLTYDQAIKAGYKPIAGGDKAYPLARYLSIGEKPPLFHPDIVNKMGALNAHLEYERSFPEKWQKFFNKVDPIVGVMKSSITIWRPGHHMVSLVGNTLFNATAGVGLGDYATAMRIMTKKGEITDLDEGAFMEAIRSGTPKGYKAKGDGSTVEIFIGGKLLNVPLDVITRGADEVSGVPITARAARDEIREGDPNQFGLDGIVQRFAPFNAIAKTDHKIAQVAAARDNLARYALFVKELRTGSYKSLEDAFLAAGQKVHEFHPTVGTLTAGERKVARRLFYFYTWQKQALFKILEIAANKPQYITMPSKLQYALATANGMNPESFGDGWDPEGLYASYFTNSVFAPTEIDPTLGAVGIRPASPQLDVIDAYFSKFAIQPGRGFWEGMGEMMGGAVGDVFIANMSPIVKIPAELATGNKVNDMGQIGDISEYLLDQTGLGTYTRAAGFTPWGEKRTDFKEGDYGIKDRERQWFNIWTGFKSTYYQSPASLERARQERIDYWARIYKTGKYTEDK